MKAFKLIGRRDLLILVVLIMLDGAAGALLQRYASHDVLKSFGTVEQFEARYGVKKLIPHETLGYVNLPKYQVGRTTHDEAGFRGGVTNSLPRHDLLRVVCLGGGNTYGVGTGDDTLTYPSQLQLLLNRERESSWVINAGVSGHSAREIAHRSLLDFNEHFRIYLPEFNEVFSRLYWPPRDEEQQAPMWVPNLEPQQHPWIARSHLLRMLLVWLDLLPSAVQLNELGDYAEASLAGELMAQLREERYPDGRLVDTPLAKVLEFNGPKPFENHLRKIIWRGGQGTDGRLLTKTILATMPYRKPPTWDSPMQLPEVRGAIDQHNEVVREVARETGMPLVDLEKAMGTGRAYFRDSVTLNEKGLRKVAELLAEVFESNLSGSSEGLLEQP